MEIHYSPITETLWVVQSKYVHSGLNEPDLGDVTKFRTGLENLLEGRFDTFFGNEKWKDLLAQVENRTQELSYPHTSHLVLFGSCSRVGGSKAAFRDA